MQSHLRSKMGRAPEDSIEKRAPPSPSYSVGLTPVVFPCLSTSSPVLFKEVGGASPKTPRSRDSSGELAGEDPRSRNARDAETEGSTSRLAEARKEIRRRDRGKEVLK